MGPLCGKCKWAQQPRSYMKNEKCLRCQGDETALVISILFLLVAVPSVVALVLWRFTRARALTYRIYRRVFDIGRFKVRRVEHIQTRTSRTIKRMDLNKFMGSNVRFHSPQ